MQTIRPSCDRSLVETLGRTVASVTFLFLLLAPSLAAATPEYPVAVDVTIGTSCPNPNSRCLMCHTTSRGGQGTASQAFARKLRTYGLNRGRDAELLQSTLMQLPDDWDSDEDGEPDKEELSHCGNPSGEDFGLGPEYGCDGAHLAPQADGAHGPLFGVLSLIVGGLAVGGRWRRRETRARLRQ
jgi:hypothetical protein